MIIFTSISDIEKLHNISSEEVRNKIQAHRFAIFKWKYFYLIYIPIVFLIMFAINLATRQLLVDLNGKIFLSSSIISGGIGGALIGYSQHILILNRAIYLLQLNCVKN
jgi:hypothetical protein